MTEPVHAYHFRLWVLAAVVLVADLASKYFMFANLQLHESVTIVENLLNFTHNQLNKGALFGWGGEHGELANYAFAAFSAVAIVFIAAWSRRKEVASDRLLMTALGLIMGGAAGNLYDRLVFGGVRDFIHVRRHFDSLNWRFDFAVFNLADSALVVGACLLFLHTVLHWRDTSPSAPAGDNPADGKL